MIVSFQCVVGLPEDDSPCNQFNKKKHQMQRLKQKLVVRRTIMFQPDTPQ
jgi:hypothetical protein